MSFLSRHPQYLRIIQVTQTEINSPTADQLADYATLYQLNVRPYTRYISNGTILVLAGEGGTAGVDTITAQAMIDASITAIPSNATGVLLKARANHTGTDPAGSVVVAFNGKTVEQCMVEIYAALAGAGPTAPQITTDPTISDTTPNVAQTLTVTAGTVTGGAHTETYFWSANGVPITSLSTSTTYVVGAAYAGQVLSVTQRSTLNTGGLYSERTSAATSAVVGTVPTNSAAPTITPTGAQAVGTAYSVASLGTWANDTSATVEYQWLLNLYVNPRSRGRNDQVAGTKDDCSGRIYLVYIIQFIDSKRFGNADDLDKSSVSYNGHSRNWSNDHKCNLDWRDSYLRQHTSICCGRLWRDDNTICNHNC
jgi:hypothetical protein